jgi:peptidoglycan/xylan/chitin deacetylase (PgdA/CDA1 family)
MRVAELLMKYRLSATFYVPLRTDHDVLTPPQVRELSASFEIGAHTVGHIDLTTVSDDVARVEIAECKIKLEQATGRACTSFCFPLGRFRRRHLTHLKDAGYRVARTVEFMSLDPPRYDNGLWMMPTTIQAVPAGHARYLRNSIKRLRLSNLLRYARTRKVSWPATLEALLESSIRRGGVVHLWGHSWEIEQNSDWHNLDEAFALLARYRSAASFVSNGELPGRLGPRVLHGSAID